MTKGKAELHRLGLILTNGETTNGGVVIEMKISEMDRAEALIRMPEYLKDLDTLNRLRKKASLSKLLKETRELERKYSLLRIVTPELIEAIKKQTDKRRQVELKRIFKKPNRFQYVKIDLNKPKKENLLLVSHIYDMWKEVIEQHEKKPKERKRELTYSPWSVYDIMKKDELNLSEIARQLSGEKGYPSGNEKLMAAYKAVERAYKRATEIIEHIKQEIKDFTPAKHKPLRDIVRDTIKEFNE